jgi:Zn-dependent protease
MLFALGQPVAFAGLLVAFLLALTLRAVAVRLVARWFGLADVRVPLMPSPREDIDPFGAVAAAVGGAGWGKTIDVDAVPRVRGRGRAAGLFAAGPVVTLIVSQLFFLGYAVSAVDPFPPAIYRLSDIVRGQFDASYAGQLVLALAGGLLAFGLLALLPIPPLDGFGLLWSAMRRPGTGMQQYRLWFGHKNIGVLVLLVCCFFPLSYPLLLWPLDLIGAVFLSIWG